MLYKVNWYDSRQGPETQEAFDFIKEYTGYEPADRTLIPSVIHDIEPHLYYFYAKEYYYMSGSEKAAMLLADAYDSLGGVMVGWVQNVLIVNQVAGQIRQKAVEAVGAGRAPNNTINTHNLENANYAQTTYSNTFSPIGQKELSNIAGRPIKTVTDLVNALTNGVVKATDIPVNYIVREGQVIILNTRTAQALTQAGIPRGQWSGINRTGDGLYEGLLNRQLSRNALLPTGGTSVNPKN